MTADRAAREILNRLVAFPTVSRDSNLDLVAWVEGYLAGFGVASTRVMNAEGTKASLYASIGPAVSGGVVLSGHSDVVPVDGQNWVTDPWTVVEHDGRLYGRGTCDMKGFVAQALAMVPLALAAGIRRPLQIALSHDEELGCIGAPPMVAEMATLLPRAAAVIVGEPTGMKAVTGHKGSMGYHVHLRGHEVHSSIMHRGVSAIMVGAKLIAWANRCNEAGARAVPGALGALFDPPFTTVHVGMISGGTAHNITAADCRFGIDFRLVPGETAAEWEQAFRAEVARVERGMQAIHPGTGVTLERSFDVMPLMPETEGAAETLVRRISGDNGRQVVSFGTDAGHFQARGYSTVVCGPGDIAQAHQPDEFLSLAEFGACGIFLRQVVAELAS